MASRFANTAVATFVMIALAACHDTAARVASPPPPVDPDSAGASFFALYGDEVNGDPGVDGAEPLVVSLIDAQGRPVRGAHVAWSATGGGTLSDPNTVTDAEGLARTSWILADHSESQSVSASSAVAQVSFHGSLRESPAITPDSLLVLDLTTFDSSGQVVHPDVIFLPHSWDAGRARLAMAITPYPYGDPAYENPSLFVSGSGTTWTLPAGATNPVAKPDVGYLSDPALVFDDAAHTLRMYYRAVRDGDNVVLLVTTVDGVSWSPPQEIVRVPSHGLISPTVVRRSGGEWLMWSVDAGPNGCSSQETHVDMRESDDGLHWGPPTRVALDQPGGYPWHIDVKWIPQLHEYWALYNLKSAGNCVTPAVYLATSPDGVQWTVHRNPVLQRGAIPALADIVYRSSFIYTKSDDMVTFYFSGARWDGARYIWSGAVARRARASLLDALDWSGTRLLQPSRIDLPNPEPSMDAPLRRR